jgi:hypothetical protein
MQGRKLAVLFYRPKNSIRYKGRLFKFLAAMDYPMTDPIDPVLRRYDPVFPVGQYVDYYVDRDVMVRARHLLIKRDASVLLMP